MYNYGYDLWLWPKPHETQIHDKSDGSGGHYDALLMGPNQSDGDGPTSPTTDKKGLDPNEEEPPALHVKRPVASTANSACAEVGFQRDCVDSNLKGVHQSRVYTLKEGSRTKANIHGGIVGARLQGCWKGEDFEGKFVLNLEQLTQRQRGTELRPRRTGGNAILSVNVGGSREALDWALEQEVDVLLIQEHRMLGNPMKGAMKKARWLGWARNT